VPHLGYPSIEAHQEEDIRIHNFARHGQIQKEGREGALADNALVDLELGTLRDTRDAAAQ
jgi:hypothetical protein